MAGTYERLKQEEKRESQLKAPLSIPSRNIISIKYIY